MRYTYTAVVLLMLLLLSGCMDVGMDYSGDPSLNENAEALSTGTTYALAREKYLTQAAVGVRGSVSLPDIYHVENLSGIRIIMGSEDSASACSENIDSRATVTDVDGGYVFNNVPEGSYSICAEVDMNDGTRLAMVLSKIVVDPTILYDAPLNVGDITLGELVAQTVTIHLFVIDAISEEPLANSPVSIQAAGKFINAVSGEITTDANGYLSYSGYATEKQLFNPGGPNDYVSEAVSFVISKLGYNTVVTSLSNDSFQEQNITVVVALDESTLFQVGSDTDWVSLQAADYHLSALKESGSLYTWGNYKFGSFLSGEGNRYSSDLKRMGSAGSWRSIGSASVYVNFSIKKDGSLWAWFDSVDIPSVAASGKWKSISSKNWIAGVADDGSLWAWLPKMELDVYSSFPGTYNSMLDLEKNRVELKQLGNEYDWKSVVASQLALKEDGSLWRWRRDILTHFSAKSSDTRGQNAEGHDTLEQIGNDRDWVSADKIMNHQYKDIIIALKSDGTLWAMGNLNSPHSEFDEFYQVGQDNDWKKITAHWAGSLMIKNDGTLWRWDGNNYILPEKIGVDTDWATAAISPRFGAAIKTDGTLWAWGNDWWDKL